MGYTNSTYWLLCFGVQLLSESDDDNLDDNDDAAANDPNKMTKLISSADGVFPQQNLPNA